MVNSQAWNRHSHAIIRTPRNEGYCQMSNTIALLERVRSIVPRKSKGGVAAALGIDRSNLNQMYAGKRYPNTMQTIAIARLLRADVEEIAALIALDKARTREAKEEALRRAPRLPPAAALALAIAAGITSMASPSGKGLAEKAQLIEPAIHYTKRLMNWLKSVLALRIGYAAA